MNKNERNFWLDWMMFIVFSITVVSGFLLWLVIPSSNTSAFAGIDRAVWLAFHVGSGFLGLLGVIIHIAWHWYWLKALRGRSLRTLKRPVRANRVVDRSGRSHYLDRLYRHQSIRRTGMAAICRPAHRGNKNIRSLPRSHQYCLVGFSGSAPGITSAMGCFGYPTLFAFWFSN